MITLREFGRVLVAAAAGVGVLLACYGCGIFRAPVPKADPERVTATLKDGVRTVTQTVYLQDYTVLNVIGGLSALIVFATLMVRAFGIPIPWKATTTALMCMVGSWVLRTVLADYMWLAALLSVISCVFAGMVVAYSYRAWVERRLGIDIDRDGTVGSKPE